MTIEESFIERLVNTIYTDVDMTEELYKKTMKSAMNHWIDVIKDIRKMEREDTIKQIQRAITIYEKEHEGIPTKTRREVNCKDYIRWFNDCRQEYEEGLDFIKNLK